MVFRCDAVAATRQVFNASSVLCVYPEVVTSHVVQCAMRSEEIRQVTAALSGYLVLTCDSSRATARTFSAAHIRRSPVTSRLKPFAFASRTGPLCIRFSF